MTILKVQYLEEIRRVTLDKHCISLSELENKVRYMFPQLYSFSLAFRDDDGNNIIDIKTEEDLLLGFAQANARQPPILRIIVSTVDKAEVKIEDNAPSESAETEGEGTSTVSEDESVIHSCSSCSETFDSIAVRYKCINCLDVVLCESCESKSVHNPIHLLVKLRLPCNQLALKQQLIFTSHIEDSKEKAAAKSQRKDIRKAMRQERAKELKKKEERINARRDRLRRGMIRQNRNKKEKKRRRLPEVLPLVEPEETSSVVPPVVDPVPVEAAAGVLAIEETAVSEPVSEPVVAEEDTVVEPPKEVDVPVESESDTVVPVVDTQFVEEQEQSWSLSNLMSGFRLLPGAPREATPQVDVSDYRIQGISFVQKLEELENMGFTDKNRNILVLVKHLANLERAVEELVSG